jgi:hypothetical protein
MELRMYAQKGNAWLAGDGRASASSCSQLRSVALRKTGFGGVLPDGMGAAARRGRDYRDNKGYRDERGCQAADPSGLDMHGTMESNQIKPSQGKSR